MMDIVPEDDGWVLQGMLIAYDAQRCRCEQKVSCVLGGQVHPARGEYPGEMAVTEEEDATAIREGG